jgi:hypothetical protein
MNTKEIEKLGLQALEEYLRHEFSDRVELSDIRNAGNIEKKFGCDLILKIDDKAYFTELKASLATGLPTNIRFTHQTLATMYNAGVLHNMIVVFVYNLAEGLANAKFKFFRFGDFKPDQIIVEPHFIVQPIQTINKAEASGTESPIKDSLGAVLAADSEQYDIGEVFQSKVSDHMKLSRNI